MKKQFLITSLLLFLSTTSLATQIYVTSNQTNTVTNAYPSPWVNNTNNTNNQPANTANANTSFGTPSNDPEVPSVPLSPNNPQQNINTMTQNAIAQTLMSVPNMMTGNNTTTVLAYDDTHKNAWMNSCTASIRDQRVATYAQEFCECGWQRISSGSLPPALLLSQTPNDVKQKQVILASISQLCVVQVKANHQLG
ncbi:MAG: hypothetical protein AB7F64_00485 [Gammaproteobacteria bacterium]